MALRKGRGGMGPGAQGTWAGGETLFRPLESVLSRKGRWNRRIRRSCRPAALFLLAGLALAGRPVAAQDSDERPAEARSALPEGVTPEIQLAIERGLRFLIQSQAPDGSLSGQNGCYPVAMTAPSGVALLASGSSATRGPYAAPIRRAEAFLIRAATPEGLFSTGAEEGNWNEQRS